MCPVPKQGSHQTLPVDVAERALMPIDYSQEISKDENQKTIEIEGTGKDMNKNARKKVNEQHLKLSNVVGVVNPV